VDRDKESQTTRLLITLYYEFFSRFSVDLSSYYLDIVVLKDISRRYWRDVRRLHDFHDITLIDNHKIAGYLTYWISKLKPITPINTQVYRQNAETPMFVNELYALYVAGGRINCHLKSINSDKKLQINNEFVKSLLYTLKYRITTGDNLALMYYFVENS